MEQFSEQYKAGWNYRCTYVEGGKYKLPRNIPKNYEFLDGFEACNSAYNAAISEAIRTLSNPVYPTPY